MAEAPELIRNDFVPWRLHHFALLSTVTKFKSMGAIRSLHEEIQYAIRFFFHEEIKTY